MIDLEKLTIKKAHTHLSQGDFSVEELANAYRKRIEEVDPDIHAYLEVFDDISEQAAKAEAKFKDGSATLLTGIPLAMKDNILIKGRKVSAASKMLENYTAVYDATVSEKLKNEGTVFLGRTNMDEFAMGSSTESSFFGSTKNPVDVTRVPGGSSGGSAASVAMLGALAALGSDTGGSVRQPASFCGCVGLKPTYGAVSRYGLIAMGSSLDQIGPLARTVADVEVLFEAIRGQDSLDSTTFDRSLYEKDVKGEKKVIGVPKQVMDAEGMNKECRLHLEKAIKHFEEMGYSIREINLPHLSYSLSAYYIIMAAEASTNLSRLDGVKYGFHATGENLREEYMKTRGQGFGNEVRRRIMLGTYVLSAGYYDAYYNKATDVRKVISNEFKKAFLEVDAIISPTTPTPAFALGEKISDPLQMYLEDIFTVPANIAGIPALSVPFGNVSFEGKELPLGIQLSAAFGREDILFSLGKKLLHEEE